MEKKEGLWGDIKKQTCTRLNVWFNLKEWCGLDSYLQNLLCVAFPSFFLADLLYHFIQVNQMYLPLSLISLHSYF